jgi:hypothetical protein
VAVQKSAHQSRCGWSNLLKQIVIALRTDKEIWAAAPFMIAAIIRH